MMNTRIHFIKLVHKCLPTTGQKNWRDNGNRTCPRCASTKEGRDHIIQCTARTPRAEWRAIFFKSTREFHTKHDTSPDLQQVWEVAIDQWLNATEGDVAVDSTLFPDKASPMVEQQNRICWRQVSNGRFSSEWSRLQEQHYQLGRRRTRDGKKDKRAGQRWQATEFHSSYTMEPMARPVEIAEQQSSWKNAANKQIRAQRITYSELQILYDRRESMEDSVKPC